MNVPCHHCELRCVGCHIKCRAYAEFMQENNRKKEEHLKSILAVPIANIPKKKGDYVRSKTFKSKKVFDNRREI